eukprot:15332672-Ditylum_brightwellii.AAC.1
MKVTKKVGDINDTDTRSPLQYCLLGSRTDQKAAEEVAVIAVTAVDWHTDHKPVEAMVEDKEQQLEAAVLG